MLYIVSIFLCIGVWHGLRVGNDLSFLKNSYSVNVFLFFDMDLTLLLSDRCSISYVFNF